MSQIDLDEQNQGHILSIEERFEILNKQLNKVDQEVKRKGESSYFESYAKNINTYETIVNELGFELQKNDLLSYSAIIHKIFNGMKTINYKVMNEKLLRNMPQFSKSQLNQPQEQQTLILSPKESMLHYSSAQKQQNLNFNPYSIDKNYQSTTNFRNSHIQTQTSHQIEGQFGGIQLQTENDQAFTEIVYDDHAITVTTGSQQQTHTNTFKSLEIDKKQKKQFRRRVFDNRPKVLAHKGTDTEEDFLSAAKQWDRKQKLRELKTTLEETEINISELEKQIVKQHDLDHKKYGNADLELIEMLKEMKKIQFDVSGFVTKDSFSTKQLPPNQIELLYFLCENNHKHLQKETAQLVIDYVNGLLKKQREKDIKEQESIVLNNNESSLRRNSVSKRQGTEIKKSKDKPKKVEGDTIKRQAALLEQKLKDAESTIDVKTEEISDLNRLINQNNVKMISLQQDIDNLTKLLMASKSNEDKYKQQAYAAEHQCELLKAQKSGLEKQIDKDGWDPASGTVGKIGEDEINQIKNIYQMIQNSQMDPETQKQLLNQMDGFLQTVQSSNEISMHENRSQQQSGHQSNKFFSGLVKGKKKESEDIRSNATSIQKKGGKIDNTKNSKLVQGIIKQAVVKDYYNSNQLEEIEVEEIQADGTKKMVIKKVPKDLGIIQGKDTKIVGYEKKKVIQKTMKKVIKTKQIVDDDGNVQEIDYEEEEEVEEEVEIDVPIYENKHSQTDKRTAHSLDKNQNKKGGIAQQKPSQQSLGTKDIQPQPSSKSGNTSPRVLRASPINKNFQNSKGMQLQQNKSKQQQRNNEVKMVERTVLVEQEIEEEIEETLIGEDGKPQIVKRMIKKKIQVPVKQMVPQSEVNDQETQTIEITRMVEREIEEEVEFTIIGEDGQPIVIKKMVKRKIQVPITEKLSLIEYTNKKNKETPPPEIFLKNGKKMIKKIEKTLVKKIKRTDSGKEIEYFEEEIREIIEEVNDEEAKQWEKPKVLEQEEIFEDGVRKIKKIETVIVKKQRKNSQGQMEDYYEEVKQIVIEDPSQIPQVLSQSIFLDENGQSKVRTIQKKKIRKQRINSKGETEEVEEEIEEEVILDYDQNIHQDIMYQMEEQDFIISDSYSNKNKNKFPNQSAQFSKQFSNKEGQTSQYSQYKQYSQELEQLKQQLQNAYKTISQQNDKIQSFKKNTRDQDTQTDIQLLWPLVEVILLELGVSLEKIDKIKNKYFKKDNINASDLIKRSKSQFSSKIVSREKSPNNSNDQVDFGSLQVGQANFNIQNQAQTPEKKYEQKQPRGEFDKINEKRSKGIDMDQLAEQIKKENYQTQEEELFRIFNQPKNDEEREQEDEELYQLPLEILDDKNIMLEPTIKKMYLHLKDKKPNKHLQEIRQQIRKFYKKDGDGYVSFDEFKNYYLKVVSIHMACGEDCPHLRRFYAKIGFTTLRYQRRKELKMAKQKMVPFQENTRQTLNLKSDTRNSTIFPKLNANKF